MKMRVYQGNRCHVQAEDAKDAKGHASDEDDFEPPAEDGSFLYLAPPSCESSGM
jgi:hypothetical protein